MTSRTLGVGLIGVTPGRSWAAIAHIPALRALAGYRVAALSTTRRESAEAAARAFEVPHFYDNHAQLVADPTVDIVAVTVKVPHHLELVRAALAARKHVYCEWPLGNGLAEANEMAELTRQAGVRGAVGLQARAAPVIRYVRDLVQQGQIGEVLSTTLIGSGGAWGPVIDSANAYTADVRNGATMLTIPFGHTVDALCQCLGPFRSLSASLATRRPTITVAETGETRPMSSPDQVVVTGALQSGAIANIHYRGGASRGTNLLWEINGTLGDLQVTSIMGHAQMFELSLSLGAAQDQALRPVTVPSSYSIAPAGATGFATNVAVMYQDFAADIATGSRTCPDFAEAVKMHRLIAAIDQAAVERRTVTLGS